MNADRVPDAGVVLGSPAAAYVTARRHARPQWTGVLRVRERILAYRHGRTRSPIVLACWCAVRAELAERGVELREPGR